VALLTEPLATTKVSGPVGFVQATHQFRAAILEHHQVRPIGQQWHILEASLLRMGVLVTTIYASEALFAHTIPGCRLTTELRAMHLIDWSRLRCQLCQIG
jgi:hypothetical protein